VRDQKIEVGDLARPYSPSTVLPLYGRKQCGIRNHSCQQMRKIAEEVLD
jgi:hypothetical protein